MAPPPPSHAHLLAHLVSEAFLPVTQVVPVLLSQFVSTVRTVRIAMMVPLFLGSVLAVALPPFGLIFASHKFVKLIVVSLSFPLFIFPSVIFISLSSAVLLSLLLVTLRLTSSGKSGNCIDTKYINTTRSCYSENSWYHFTIKCVFVVS